MFPFVSTDAVNKVERKLKAGRHLTKDQDQEYRWKEFSENPANSTDHEDVAFAPLNKVFDAIVKMGQKPEVLNKSPTVAFQQCPNRTPVSDRSDTARPDGQCALTDKEARQVLADMGLAYSYYSNVASAEFKKEDDDKSRIDNARKIIWSCHNTLLTDPRRRFTFGFTIEDTLVRLWFFSRSCVMATERFDFMKDTKTFIHFILALAFATPEELGLDMTISLYPQVLPDQSIVIQFKIDVSGTTYITFAPLNDFSADAIRGRGMRIWKVYREGEPDVFHVIKDVWILSDSVTEGEQLRRLYRHLETLPPSPDGREPTEYFLTVMADGFVQLSDNRDDDTHVVMMRNQQIPDEAGSTQLTQQPSAQSKPSVSNKPSRMRGSQAMTMRHQSTGLPPKKLYVQVPPRRTCSPRKHYRVVFQDVGVPIFELESVPDVLNALSDAMAGLEILHNLHLVHRDVTPSNLLVVNGIGKLSDLEYMKNFDGDGPASNVAERSLAPKDPEHKTANKAFLAVEVEDNGYLFYEEHPIDPVTNERVTAKRPSDFQFNPLHDLESIYWIVLWVLIHRSTESVTSSAQQQLALKFFDLTNNHVHDNRQHAISGNRFDTTHFPGRFSSAVKSLILAGEALWQAYNECETPYVLHWMSDPEIPFVCKFEGVHNKLIGLFQEAAQLSANTIFFVGSEDPDADDSDASSSSISLPPLKRARMANDIPGGGHRLSRPSD